MEQKYLPFFPELPSSPSIWSYSPPNSSTKFICANTVVKPYIVSAFYDRRQSQSKQTLKLGGHEREVRHRCFALSNKLVRWQHSDIQQYPTHLEQTDNEPTIVFHRGPHLPLRRARCSQCLHPPRNEVPRRSRKDGNDDEGGFEAGLLAMLVMPFIAWRKTSMKVIV